MKKFYGMGNDYMFRAVLRESEETLKHLVAALMQMDAKDIRSCMIMNPIVLGQKLGDKESILDVKMALNDDTIVNVELQMKNRGHWTERSLYYWSRAFSHLKRGEDYSDVKPTYHIGILDFTLFPDEPEFYAEYRIQNVRTGRLYSEKFCIRTLDLTQIDLAPNDNGSHSELIKWARIVKAKTLKELEVLAGDEEALRHMVSTVKNLSAKERIQLQCEAREDYERTILTERNDGYRQGKADLLTQLLSDGTITEEKVKELRGDVKSKPIDMTFERREKLFRAEEREEGRAEGRIEGQEDTIKILLADGTISAEDAEKVRKRIAKMNKTRAEVN